MHECPTPCGARYAGVTLKDMHVNETRSVWLDFADGRAHLEHCADLLEEFLKAMSRMESEYQRAALDGHAADGSL